ncbi:MAG: hypothetical protein AAGM29_11890, partial [Cyanobacteria bacterium J06588_4]
RWASKARLISPPVTIWTKQKFIIIDNDKERIAISLNVLSNQHSMQSRYKAIAQSHFILPE